MAALSEEFLNYLSSLKEFADDLGNSYIDAVISERSYRGAARKVNKDKTTVMYSINRTKAIAISRGFSPKHDMVHTVPDGYFVKGVSTFYDNKGEVSRQCVKSDVDKYRQKEIMEAAYKAMADELPRCSPIKPLTKDLNEQLCNLVVFTDYHMGQLSWGKETGADWNLEIAEKLIIDSFRNLIHRAPKAKHGILCIQGDFLHSDGLAPLTPASKHVLDVAGRFSQIVAATIRAIRLLIREFLLTHEVLHLLIMEGNHDEAGAGVWLRQMFSALYEDEKRLTVNSSEVPFYVHQHGECMLAFHHGHKVSNEQLPLLFASQYSALWGATKKRYAHCGHRHHVDEKEYSGMIVTQHPTLAARDAYSARGGWISERAANLITYHSKFGQVGRTVVCPEMFE